MKNLIGIVLLIGSISSSFAAEICRVVQGPNPHADCTLRVDSIPEDANKSIIEVIKVLVDKGYVVTSSGDYAYLLIKK